METIGQIIQSISQNSFTKSSKKIILKIFPTYDLPKRSISYENITSDLIWFDIFDDNNIYYGHNIKILNILIGKDIQYVLNILTKNYPEIEFIPYRYIPKYIEKDLFKIFVIYDSNDNVSSFIGL